MVTLALDYGEKRIGVAVSDPLGIVANALCVVERDGSELDRIVELVRERGAERIVAGMPLRMDGTEGTQARRVRGFVKELRRRLPDLEIVLSDERLSSAEARRALSQMRASIAARRDNVDMIAAQIILQRHLDRVAAEKRRRSD